VIHVGTGRRTINPELGHNLGGYGTDYPNTGVHDDLTVTALYLDDGATDAILLNFDLLGFNAATSLRIRRAVEQATGVAAERVFVACTHVHSAPEVLETPWWLDGPNPGCRSDYLARLADWSAQAAAEAKATTEECELRYNVAHADENMNRRYTFPDRRSLYIPDNKQLIGQSREYVDRELGIVAFRRKGTTNRYQAVLTNYTCHPLCVGNSSNLVTADFQGVLRQRVEETFAGCRCLATTGAAGDNHPLMPESGFASAQEMGGRLARLAIMRCYDSVSTEYDTALRLSQPHVSLPYADRTTRNLLPEGAERQRLLRTDRGELATTVSLLGIGPILLAGFPGEPMAALGAMLKWSSPFLKTYVLFTATDFVGYFPTANQFWWGGYEADTCRFERGVGERLVDAVLAEARRLLDECPIEAPALAVAGIDGVPPA
jgi:neutral ceramidase